MEIETALKCRLRDRLGWKACGYEISADSPAYPQATPPSDGPSLIRPPSSPSMTLAEGRVTDTKYLPQAQGTTFYPALVPRTRWPCDQSAHAHINVERSSTNQGLKRASQLWPNFWGIETQDSIYTDSYWQRLPSQGLGRHEALCITRTLHASSRLVLVVRDPDEHPTQPAPAPSPIPPCQCY
jgi:hypothetical protein